MEYTPTITGPEASPNNDKKSAEKKNKKSATPRPVPLSVLIEKEPAEVKETPVKAVTESLFESLDKAKNDSEVTDDSKAEIEENRVTTDDLLDEVIVDLHEQRESVEVMGGVGETVTEQAVHYDESPSTTPEESGSDNSETEISVPAEVLDPIDSSWDSSAEASPDIPGGSAGGGGGEAPPPSGPESDGDSPEEPPKPPRIETSTEYVRVTPEPEEVRRRYESTYVDSGSEFRQAPKPPKSPEITQAELNDKVHRAEKRGVRRGVLAGGLTGWWFGKRRGEKLVGRELKAEQKAHAETAKTLESERYNAKQRLQEISRTKEHLAAAVPAEQYRTPEQQAVVSPEKQRTEETKKVPIEEQPVEERWYTPPQDRRIEASSWHRIEVDNKTGEVAQNPEVPYGEEFNRELRGEREQAELTNAQREQAVGGLLVRQTGVIPADSDSLAPAGQSPKGKAKNTGDNDTTGPVCLKSDHLGRGICFGSPLILLGFLR